jgi:hypothetical protein
MRRSLVVAAILASLAATARANDGVELAVRSKMYAASAASAFAIPSKQVEAPSITGHDPLPELMLREELDRRTLAPRGTCNASATALCYDLAEGRVSYRAAREYMPKFDGLQPEAISLRRNTLVFKYSFR